MALPFEAPLSEVLKDARVRWNQTKTLAQRLRDRSEAGPVSAETILDYLDSLVRDKAYFENVALTPGIGAYAADQYDGYSIGADFTAFIAEIEACITWIVTALPTSDPDGQGNTWLLVERRDALTGAKTIRTFSSAQTAGLRTVLDSLAAMVE